MRRYTGLLIEDEKFGNWLGARLDEVWDQSVTPGNAFWVRLKEDFFKSPASIIAAIMGALIGAAATLLAVFLK